MSVIVYVDGLNFPIGILFDSNDNLYIANANDNNIIKVDTSGNKTIFSDGYNFTENLVFDITQFPSGYIYVMDSLNNLYKINSNGNKTVFTTLTNHYLGLSSRNNNIYYTSDNKYIYSIDELGNTTEFINTTSIMNYPQSITFDKFGNIYLCTQLQNNMCKYSSSGILINEFFLTTFVGGYFRNCIFDNNYLYTIEYDNTYKLYLKKYDYNGNFISLLYSDYIVSYGMAFDSNNDLYFTTLNSVLKFSSSTPIYFNNFVSGLNVPDNLTINLNNDLFIANSGSNNIIKADTSGSTSIFSSGFNGAQNLVFDNSIPTQNLFFIDNSNSLYKIDSNGNKTIVSSLISHTSGLAFNNNNLYYTSSDNSLYKINPSYITTKFIDTSTTMNIPTIVCFDSLNYIYIGSNNNYIMKYDNNGNLINQYFITTLVPGYFINFSINNNYFYTLEYENSSGKSYLRKYNINGNYIETIYTFIGTSSGITFDSNNNLYITQNNSVLKSSSTPPPTPICFHEDTLILSVTDKFDEKYIPIKNLKKGDLIKTYRHGYKKIEILGKSTIFNSGDNQRIKDRLYLCKKDNYENLFQDLIITGCHSILVDKLTDEQHNKIMNILGDIYVTDGKNRLLSCVDEKSIPFEKEGTFTIYHIALEHENIYCNYGIYANGLLVESTSIRTMKDLSGMTFIE